MSTALNKIVKSKGLSIYLSKEHSDSLVKTFVISTPETRAICNDPLVSGVQYTRMLSSACAKVLNALKKKKYVALTEEDTTVFHILRGGLNFGLREALSKAFGWNNHASAFVSAQRARRSDNPEDWFITESDYRKINLKPRNNIVFGDVVATGTSLEFGLKRLIDAASENGTHSRIESVVFFTIGGPRSHEILSKISRELKERYPEYRGGIMIYIEGIFAVATPHTAMSIKYDGTDLLRTTSVLSPEFVASQYKKPSYPIERCTIYDAGSRAFDVDEYLHDVRDYWTRTLALAEQGMTYGALLKERFPELDAARFAKANLAAVCKKQLKLLPVPSGARAVIE